MTWTLWDAELSYGPVYYSQRDAARANPLGAEPLWGVAVVKEDGSRFLKTFPHSTLEWRSAEYGIDPDDKDTLLDVILHESYIPREDDPLALIDPASAKILTETRDMPTCWTPGVSDKDRLDAHLARIAAVKKHRVRLDPASMDDRQGALAFVGSRRIAPADPLDLIRAAQLDPIRVESRRLAVKWARSTGGMAQEPNFLLKPPDAFLGMPTEMGAASV
ncbi:hypothetical protein [Nonomuraea gerenzanensis]|uniref:hypothetical protein n=1 Tax=Nonomuraea gerenzanensis TaxID=93944 RepID=UPI001CD94639|nr:hypothetical protein [Nonomuraea gerenzanensis]UBU16686.1 hypothetical protein LCN96_17205 [Nonomuraea gerenzanensis]